MESFVFSHPVHRRELLHFLNSVTNTEVTEVAIFIQNFLFYWNLPRSSLDVDRMFTRRGYLQTEI